MTRGSSDTLPTELPSRYERLFAWRLDRRCKAVRDVAADLFELWQDLGGVDNLSTQKRWLCERVVYLRRRCLDYEAAVLHNSSRDPSEPERPLPMDAGAYSNFANVLQGYLRTLGLTRQAKPARTLREIMSESAPEDEGAAASTPSDPPAPVEASAAPGPSNAATDEGAV